MTTANADLIGRTFRSPDSIIRYEVIGEDDDRFVIYRNPLTGETGSAIADFVRLAIADEAKELEAV